MRIIRNCFILVGIFIQLSLFANKAINYRFQYLQIEDGLPQNTINTIARDAYGFMWFGTNNGLCRYDGYSFESFKTDNVRTNELPNNMIRDIKVTSDSTLWIGSSNGLSYFDEKNSSIVAFIPADNSIRLTKISALESYNEQLWVGTENQGIFILQKDNSGLYAVIKHFCTENHNLLSNSINVIYKSPDEHLFVGTETGAMIFNANSNAYETQIGTFDLPQNSRINDIFLSSKGDLYISSYTGLEVLKKNATTAQQFVNNALDNKSIAHNTIVKVREDATGQILVGSLGGVQLFDADNGTFNALPEEGPDHFKLNNQFISEIYCDKHGNVWIGTEKGGVNKYNVYQNQFEFYAIDPNDQNSLNENNINSILKEKENLWIGTAGGGLNQFNFKTGKFFHYTHMPFKEQTISSDYITSLVRGSDGYLYAGSWGDGLNRISTQQATIQIQRITRNTQGITNEVVDYFISSLENDPRGFLIIGTQGGLSTYNYGSKKFTSLSCDNTEIPPLTEIGCLLLDTKDFYWVGTRNGLFRFPASSIRTTPDPILNIDHIQYYSNNVNDTSSLPGNYVISLQEDHHGNVWIGTYGNGLAKCTIDSEGNLVCTNYSKTNGLSNNVIYGIQEDNSGMLWLSTDYGLTMFNPNTKQVKNFFKQDGLLNNQFYWSASHKSYDGELYFGGTEGLNYFKPENIFNYNYVPEPKITRLKIYNKEVLQGEIYHNKMVINKPIYEADTIYLSYKDNNISLDFSAFDFYLPDKVTFSYKLTNVDKDWISVPAQRRFANYSNLSGGTYQFLLKASNGDGIWNETPTQITIVITPPFWETKTFKILLVIVVVLLTFSLIQLQMRRIIKQKKVLEEKVKLRTQKIEDQKVILERQSEELINYNKTLEKRQAQIEAQKMELEHMNNEIMKQRDELIVLNNKVKDINMYQMQFFTNISHEFRTPLTLIISPLERLLGKFKDQDETLGILKVINKNAQRLLMLINQLLEIRKIETGNKDLMIEPTETQNFLLEIFHAFDELALKNKINYRYEIDAVKVVWIDKEKLENVLYNLLSNAFKFTPAGETILFKAISIKAEQQDLLEISISDTGSGIPEDQIDKLFDRFYQVSANRRQKSMGTGIGLSMVKSMVQIMHGNIKVNSKPGTGSTFTIVLPVNKSSFAEHEIDKSGQVFESNIKNKVALLYDQILEKPLLDYTPNESMPEKILLAEDNAEMRSFISSNLSMFYRVTEVENGQQAYELAKKEDFALVISDIMMPEMDGLEFCRKLKNNLYTSHIPIILLTAKGNAQDFVDGLEQGADDYISKPFNIEILLAKITTLIENRKLLRNKFSKLEEVDFSDITSSSLDQKFFEKVNETVEKYYTDPAFDVDHFAAEMFVSRSQLYKKMKAITNLSANDFINVYRLKKAKELLGDTTLQISEIAYATGFNDPKYFSRIFKKFYNVSPSELIKK